MNRNTAPAAGWRRTLLGASVAGAVGTAVSLAGAPGAFAAGDYLEFSVDGMTYAPSIAGPLFRELLEYVPGGTSSATIWIRNNSEDPAQLSSAAVVVRSDSELDNYLGLRTRSGSSLSPRNSLGGQGTCTELQDVWDLGPGEEREIRLILDLAADAPNNTMNRSADLDVIFLLESKDAASRQACAALGNPTQPSGQSGAGAGDPGPVGASVPSEAATLPGTRGARQTGSNSAVPAALPQRPAGEGPVKQDPRAAIIPAGFQSTVEPIMRTLQGTLLIAMSVLLAAAVVLRFRKRQVDE